MPYAARLITILVSIALTIAGAAAGASSAVDPRAAAGSGIQGTVTFATGVPAPKVTVSAFRTRTATTPVAKAVTGVAGRYRLALPRGGYFLRFHGGGAVTEFHHDAVTRRGADAVWVPRGRFATANARVKPVKAVLTGKVYDAETKTPLLTSRIEVWRGFTRVASTRPARDGRFVLRGLAAGEYRLKSENPDRHYGGFGRAVRLTSGKVNTANLAVPRYVRISGTITDASTGEPATLVQVQVALGTSHYAHASPDGDGRYELYTSYRGATTLRAWSVSYGTIELPITLSRSDRVVDLQMKPYVPADVVGLVRTEAGEPVADAPVQLWRGRQVIASTVTGADGRYVFPDVAPGSYMLMAPDCRVNVGVFTTEEDSQVVADDLVVGCYPIDP